MTAHGEDQERAAQREAAAGAVAMIASNLRDYVTAGVMAEFVAAADACRTCAEFTGKTFDPRSAPPTRFPVSSAMRSGRPVV